ncbi:MAG: hypothetical protein ACK4WH_11455 [Phycisphaerales bacterium]
MNRLHRFLKTMTAAIVVAGAAFAFSPAAVADTVTLKDGTVLDGTIIVETESFLRIRIKIGGIETVRTFSKDDVSKIVRDTPGTSSGTSSSPAPTKPEKDMTKEEKKAESDRVLNSSATRVAILNFGAPSEWGKDVNDMVGREITAEDFRKAIPLLEKDKVQVVVIRINSGGGALSEMEPFQKLFQNEYKTRFRTVAWVESAISCAAMSPWPIEEWYFLPNGNVGACTGWYGNLTAVKGAQLEMVIALMETASKWGKRDPAIMKAMQIQVPLSATIDPVTGEVHWFQDTTGEHLVNAGNHILTLTAQDAIKYKFGKGIAATKEELAKVMGLGEVVWAGEEASRFIDDQLKKSDRAHRQWQVVAQQYTIQMQYASQAQDPDTRGGFLGKARRYLEELRSLYRVNKNFGMFTGIDQEWFDQQEELIRRLARR